MVCNAQEKVSLSDMCIEILRATHDGDELSPEHLYLVELAVNGHLSAEGEKVFRSLYDDAVVNGPYKKPFFHDIPGLTIDLKGYILWKGIIVEHYDFSLAFSERGRLAALGLAERCRFLEAIGAPISEGTVIWRWEEAVLTALAALP